MRASDFLREVELRHRIIAKLSKCFEDKRDQRYVEHNLKELLAQRIIALPTLSARQGCRRPTHVSKDPGRARASLLCRFVLR